MTQSPAIKTIAPWYGSNRMLAESVGRELRGCDWVGIPFCGGCSEILHIGARSLMVADVHRELITLARVMQSPYLGPALYRKLRRCLFHPDTLRQAQERFKIDRLLEEDDELECAFNYFIAVWMGRSAKAGTDSEFSGGLAVRWDAGGGSSAVRFQNAVRSIPAWRLALKRCDFCLLDVFEFLAQVAKKKESESLRGLYLDPPFPGPGDLYKHKFPLAKLWDLARALHDMPPDIRIVCRFYDVPVVHEMYPEASGWRWIYQTGRKATNEDAPEVLVVRQEAA